MADNILLLILGLYVVGIPMAILGVFVYNECQMPEFRMDFDVLLFMIVTWPLTALVKLCKLLWNGAKKGWALFKRGW